jgi:hypothetical protein
MTISRSELMAVLIGVKCQELVSKLVELPIKKRYLWTDSVCVLGLLFTRLGDKSTHNSVFIPAFHRL